MRIGIIGSGNMGSALGKLWAQLGHEVMFSYSRDRAKLEAIAADAGANAQVGSPAEAFIQGEPYNCSGVFERITIRQWRQILPESHPGELLQQIQNH